MKKVLSEQSPTGSNGRLIGAGACLLLTTVAVIWTSRPEGASPTSGETRVVPHGTFLSKTEIEINSVRSATTLRDEAWARTLRDVAETDESRRSERIAEFIEKLPLGDLSAAIAYFRSRLADGAAREIASGLLRRWAGLDPQNAALNVESMPPGLDRLAALNDVAIVWSGLDFDQAVEWIKKWPEENERHAGLMTVSYEAARSNPLAALNVAVAVAPTKERDVLIEHVARQWAAEEPQAAATWAERIEPVSLRQQVLGGIAVEWSDRDPVAAANFAATRLVAGKLQDDVVIGILNRWVQKDPSAAAGWVAKFGEGPLRRTAMDALVNLWPEGK
jgi:hypothetical protein